MTLSVTNSSWPLLAMVLWIVGGAWAQPTRLSTEGPRLCQPVSYREPLPTIVLQTTVPMLGDRYQEVHEALAGWNETGVPLVGKHDGKWEPVPCGDDTGLFYLVPLLARSTGWSVDQSLDAFLLGALGLSAAIGAVGVWLTVSGMWQRSLGLVPIALGSWLALKMGDVYLIQACSVVMLLPWLIYALRDAVEDWRRFAVCGCSGLVLGLAQWIRTPAASPLLVFIAVLLYRSPLKRFTKALLCAALIGGMCLPLLYAQLPLQKRSQFLELTLRKDAHTLDRHLFWHSLYLGLAYLTNPYVPAWRDAGAVAYVESVNASVVYGSPEYEAILQARVKQIARQDYRFIIYTVFAKVGVLSLFLLVCANVGLVAAVVRPKPRGEEAAFWLAMLFAAMPGIIAIPVPQYVVGMLVLALYYWFYSVTCYLRSYSFSSS